jgi:HEAT repeat protein
MKSERDRHIDVLSAGHNGDEPTARTGLVDSAPHIRAGALEALQRLGALSDSDLIAAMDDDATEVRRRCGELLSRTFRPALRASLATALHDPEPDVVEAAATALGEDSDIDDETLDLLHNLTANHDDPLCRESAIAALGSLGKTRSLDHILAAMADKPNVRRRAVLALTPYDDPRADQAMNDALEDKDRQVRTLAAELADRPT